MNDRPGEGNDAVESPIIRLPENKREDAKRLLASKLYQFTTLRQSKDGLYQPPHARVGNMSYRAVQAAYEVRILLALLACGEVETYELCRDLEFEHGGFYLDGFEAACQSIDSFLNDNAA